MGLHCLKFKLVHSQTTQKSSLRIAVDVINTEKLQVSILLRRLEKEMNKAQVKYRNTILEKRGQMQVKKY